MKTKILYCFTACLVTCLMVSCNDESIEKSLQGSWNFSIRITFEGRNSNTGNEVSEVKEVSGTYKWDEGLKSYTNHPIVKYNSFDAYIKNGTLDFYNSKLEWEENGLKYEAACWWNSVNAKYNMKKFAAEGYNSSWVEVTYPDKSVVFCSHAKATLEANKIQ